MDLPYLSLLEARGFPIFKQPGPGSKQTSSHLLPSCNQGFEAPHHLFHGAANQIEEVWIWHKDTLASRFEAAQLNVPKYQLHTKGPARQYPATSEIVTFFIACRETRPGGGRPELFNPLKTAQSFAARAADFGLEPA